MASTVPGWARVWRGAAAGLLLAGSGLATPVQAQVFRMTCEAEGVIAQLDNKKLAPARITLELQTIGRHLYVNVIGPADYQMRVSSLVTDTYTGVNLSSETRLGARKTHKVSGLENQVTVERQSVLYKAYNDVEHQGRLVRIHYQGPCKLPVP